VADSLDGLDRGGLGLTPRQSIRDIRRK